MDDSDALRNLVAELTAGHPEARDRVIELCADRLRSLAHRMLGQFPSVRRYDDTDDVFQGAAMRLHRALGQMAATGEPPRELMALAATQIHRELVDLARRNARAGSYAANHDTNVVASADGPPRFLVDDVAAADVPLDRWEQFHAAIAALPDRLREVFQLVWYLGADQRTIAGMLGCSERTVKTYWREARDAVRLALEDERPTP